MAGPFAHITLVDTICQEPKELDSIASLTKPMKLALTKFNNFCELGAVSPDCPYLKLLDTEAEGWGNVMHYWQTADFVRRAVPYVSALDFASPDAQKCLAWLFGYTAHLVTDLAVHPMINLKVGPYEQNKTDHRRCEMNQDVHIFHHLGFGEVVTAEYLKRCGVMSCCDGSNKNKLDPVVRQLWGYCLKDVLSSPITIRDGLSVPKKAPDPDDWFRHYTATLDGFAEEGAKLIFFFRQIAEEEALVYLPFDEINPTYIHHLKTPDGSYAEYEDVFKRAQECVKKTWAWLGNALSQKDATLFALANGDLDTGLTEDQKPIFWEHIA